MASRAPSESIPPRADAEALGLVLAGLAHDVRSIGAAAEGLAFRASTRVQDDARLAAYLEAIRESMSRLVGMASGALDYVEAGREPRREPGLVRLDQVAERVVATCLEESAAVGVTLSLQARPAVVRAERDDVFRLTLNLVRNAVFHGARKRGGSVHVRVLAWPASRAVLAVRDSGPGFPAGLLGDGPRVPRFIGGHGLGLCIADSLARKHGGQLRLCNLPGGCALVAFPFPEHHEAEAA